MFVLELEKQRSRSVVSDPSSEFQYYWHQCISAKERRGGPALRSKRIRINIERRKNGMVSPVTGSSYSGGG